jgi:hypothetical protein
MKRGQRCAYANISRTFLTRKIDGTTRNSFDAAVCGLYSITHGRGAMRRLFRVWCDLTGDLPLLPGAELTRCCAADEPEAFAARRAGEHGTQATAAAKSAEPKSWRNAGSYGNLKRWTN